MSPTTDLQKLEMTKIPYRHDVGSMLWLVTGSRVDIAFAATCCAKYSINSGMANQYACFEYWDTQRERRETNWSKEDSREMLRLMLVQRCHRERTRLWVEFSVPTVGSKNNLVLESSHLCLSRSGPCWRPRFKEISHSIRYRWEWCWK